MTEAVDPFNDLVAQGKDFHSAGILPYKRLPCKVFTMERSYRSAGNAPIAVVKE
jgi:hypothetical protein